MSKTYEIKITTSNHGNFGDERKAFINALNDLRLEVMEHNHLPPDSELGVKTSGPHHKAVVFLKEQS